MLLELSNGFSIQKVKAMVIVSGYGMSFTSNHQATLGELISEDNVTVTRFIYVGDDFTMQITEHEMNVLHKAFLYHKKPTTKK